MAAWIRVKCPAFLALGLVLLAGLAQAQEPKEKAKAKTKAQPPRIPAGVKVDRDLEYARINDKALLLDLYRPDSSNGPLPLIVWIHGGGWRNGSKAGSMAIPLSGRGYAVASVDYRLIDVAPFPAQIVDCRAAIRWLKAHASEYNLDPKRIGVWGASAGGHLVALLGTVNQKSTWDDIGGNSDQSPQVQAVCDYYGPANLMLDAFPTPNATPEKQAARNERFSALFGGPIGERQDLAREMSPIAHVSSDDPPFLIVHGEIDRTVPIAQSEKFAAALKNAGADVTFLRVKNGGHGFNTESDPTAEQLREQVIAFFDKHLKKKG
jgi:acetyl esterase/lipase